MNKFLLSLSICLLVSLDCGMTKAASSDVGEGDCARFEIGQELLSEEDLNIIRERILKPGETSLVSLSSGKLFSIHKGVCMPVFDDTYLVATFGVSHPRIIGFVNGNALSARVDTIDGDDILSVFYFAGGNQFALTMYRFIVGDYGFKRIERMEVEGARYNSFASSNMRSIGIEGNRVVVKNSFRDRDEKHQMHNWIIVTSYSYQRGKFVFEKEEKF